MARRRWYRRKEWLIPILLLLFFASFGVYNRVKPLPEGTSYQGEWRQITSNDVKFLEDSTYSVDGQSRSDQMIFDELFDTIGKAEEFLVLDLFLVNGYHKEERLYPKLSSQLTEAIKQQMERHPDLKVVFISDIVNTTYGSHEAEALAPLEKLGAEVVFTDLDRLRDPNVLYSSVWRPLFSWTGNSTDGWIPNPMGTNAPDVTVRSYARLLNVKANHRKVVITEDTSLVLSANPHDASAYHSNIGFRVDGKIQEDLLESERAVFAFSGGDAERFPRFETKEDVENPIGEARVVTEQQIQDAVVGAIDDATTGDIVWVGMFYLADRDIIDALEDAAERGVTVRLILDPNRNAFGQEKIGLPNLPVAAELYETRSEHLSIRWYQTGTEQYHSKLLYIEGADTSRIIGGSANYTSRNLDDYNMETNLDFRVDASSPFAQSVDRYFKKLWTNDGATYTADYEKFQEDIPLFKLTLYAIQKLFQVTTY